ncbi:hypothetical protein QWZ16_11150 [Vibrio ostreicida]|uniref:DUF3265 domain-containing protein n=1 Tax=Vibrio ostreicida TaxID=526588 RepID=A0ABT8BUA1_9VIBR|nr:hypothetical protein [Vibrio ostreicida]MDN3610258.1 hypothetical protein [Vibrio ostreicida]
MSTFANEAGNDPLVAEKRQQRVTYVANLYHFCYLAAFNIAF